MDQQTHVSTFSVTNLLKGIDIRTFFQILNKINSTDQKFEILEEKNKMTHFKGIKKYNLV